MKVIGHRGDSYNAPENTMAAFNMAWHAYADGIEIDVRETKDNHIIVIHDDNTKRVSGINNQVSHTPMNKLNNLNVGTWKHIKWIDETIPTLEQVVQSIPYNKTLYIDIKCDATAIGAIESIINRYKSLHNRIKFICFSAFTLHSFNHSFPHIESYLLADLLDAHCAHYIEEAHSIQAHGLNIHASYDLDLQVVRHIRSRNLSFHVWGVDSPEMADYILHLEPDSVTTNNPHWLKIFSNNHIAQPAY